MYTQKKSVRILKNIIYNELISRRYNVDIGVVEKYDKDNEDKTIRTSYEVDFVVYKGSKKYYIQSSYMINDENKVEQ